MRAGLVGVSAILVLGAVGSTGATAQVVGTPDIVGSWTEPFEEGGSQTPRCVPSQEANETGPGFLVCKPTAQASAVLPDGRVFYYNGIESEENVSGPSPVSLSPSSRDSQARVLDLRSGTPQWITPAQPRGGQSNPNIEEGHQSYDDPQGALGVPGRGGDGFVGSKWAELGGPESAPTSTPDDPSANDGDMFCADLTTLPDGRVMVVGGTDWYNEPSLMDRNAGDPADVGAIELEGLRNSNLFDWKTNTFSPGGHMKYGRWYPAVEIGPNGVPTVFSGVTQLITDSQLSQVTRTESYDTASNTWSENYVGPESENSLPLQPRMILTPDGKFFYPGVGQMWGPFGEAIDEVTYNFQQSFDPETKKWEVKGLAPLGARSGAFTVPLQLKPPYDKMDILVSGGTLGPPPGNWIPANPFSTITTVGADGSVSGAMTGNLNHARWFHSGILMPDGQVVVVGGADKDEVVDPGTEIPVHAAEVYNPATGSWTEVASHTRDRTYHNSALLLPDMRVLLGGHAPIASHYGGANSDQGGPFANNDNDPSFEVWSPPYLFRGARPSITKAQKGISYGEAFNIGTSKDEIESVVLMKTPSPQHVNDGDQRNIELAFTGGDGSLTATAPPSGKIAPPGYYYLVVNKKTDKGSVPSVARIVQVGVGTDLGESLQPYNDDAPAPVGSATPDEDNSRAAQASAQVNEAAQSAPAPVAAPATMAAQTASDAYTTLSASPISAPAGPLSNPVLPLTAVGVVTFAGATVRRWFRR